MTIHELVIKHIKKVGKEVIRWELHHGEYSAWVLLNGCSVVIHEDDNEVVGLFDQYGKCLYAHPDTKRGALLFRDNVESVTSIRKYRIFLEKLGLSNREIQGFIDEITHV